MESDNEIRSSLEELVRVATADVEEAAPGDSVELRDQVAKASAVLRRHKAGRTMKVALVHNPEAVALSIPNTGDLRLNKPLTLTLVVTSINHPKQRIPRHVDHGGGQRTIEVELTSGQFTSALEALLDKEQVKLTPVIYGVHRTV